MAGISLSQFRDFQLVGQGGGADVYRAVRVSTGGEVAIKAFLATLDPATIARRANREVGALVSLKGHPNIIQIEEVLQVDDAVYVVMEYAPNGSLAERIKAQGRIDPTEVASVGAQIASALAAAHSKSILHRDVKPQNILFGQFGAAKLCDFGIAAITAGEQASRTSAISIRYASPEELDGATLTSATDVYSLGATLLHAFVGRPADLNERLAGIEPLVADAPQPLRDVITRCLQLDPAQRPTAAEVHDMLGVATVASSGASTGFSAPSGEVLSDLKSPMSGDRSPAASGRAGLDGGTIGVLFDRPVDEVPPQPPTTPWFRRPVFFGAVALVALAVAAVLVFASINGGDDEQVQPPATTIAPPTTAPTTSTESTVAATTIPDTTVVQPETTAVVVAPPPVNPYGDVIGQPVDGSTGKAAAFARALQQRGDAASVAVNLSPAYFYALSFQLTPRVADPTLLPIATDTGYSIATASGPIEIRDLQTDADGNIIDGTEVGDSPFLMSVGVQLTGVCLSGRPQPCDFTLPGANPDLGGSAAQAWVLARVTADLERITKMLYVDADGGVVTSATSGGAALSVDPASGIIALVVPSNTPPGTVVQVDVVLADGRSMSFSVPAV